MHEWLIDILGFAVPLADAASSATVKAGLIGAAALVVAAVVPILLGRREREPKTVRDLREAEAKLRQEIETDRDFWKNATEAAIRGTELRDHEIDRLRRLCQTAGIDPFPPKVEEPT